MYYFATPVAHIDAFDLINVYNNEMKTHSDATPDVIDYPLFIKNL